MCTVLITYSTPPPPPAADAGAVAAARAPEAADAASVEVMVAGIDEAIAETISTALARAGHKVTCRPCVATTTTERGFDLVVVVDHLHVTHRSDTAWPRVSGTSDDTAAYAAGPAGRDGTPRVPDRLREPGAAGSVAAAGAAGAAGAPLGEATIPMTWCADFRAVEAWGRSIADHLVRFLELRAELVRTRAELVRCRALLKAVTPEPRAASAVELGRPVGTLRPLLGGERRAPHGLGPARLT